LLPVPYFHVVFTLPAAIGPIAYQNKAKLYGLLFTAAAETLTTIAADPKHLGANIGIITVLHTWGQNLQHHPHVHCIVPGGGLSPDGQRWIACKPGFFLPVRVLSRLFRRLFLQSLQVMHVTGQLQFFSDLAPLKGANEFRAYLAPLRKVEWVVYAKKPFAGSNQVLAYLARYTHRVAIANSRLLDLDKTHVRFRGKDYRQSGRHKSKVMCLDVGEFMRRFLLHVLPSGFHRIRHYGLFANGHRTDKLALCRNLLDLPSVPTDCKNDDDNSPNTPSHEPRMLRRSHDHHRNMGRSPARITSAGSTAYDEKHLVIAAPGKNQPHRRNGHHPALSNPRPLRLLCSDDEPSKSSASKPRPVNREVDSCRADPPSSRPSFRKPAVAANSIKSP